MLQDTLSGRAKYLLLLLPTISVLILASLTHAVMKALDEFFTTLCVDARDVRDLAKEWCRPPRRQDETKGTT
jgi:hypothetical protein